MTPKMYGEASNRRRCLAGVVLAGSVTLAGTAHAQSNAAPAPAATPASTGTSGTASGAGNQPGRFDVNEYIVRGNSTLPSLDIEKAVYPFEGPDRTLDDVNAARDALQ